MNTFCLRVGNRGIDSASGYCCRTGTGYKLHNSSRKVRSGLPGLFWSSSFQSNTDLWLISGNVSCATLMGIEGYFILMAQQLVSLIFVTVAFLVRRIKPVTESGTLGTDK